MAARGGFILREIKRTADARDETIYDEGGQHAVDRAVRAVRSSAQRRTHNHDTARGEHAGLAPVAIDDNTESELSANDPEVCNSGKDLAVCEGRPGWVSQVHTDPFVNRTHDGLRDIVSGTVCPGKG